MFLWMFRVMSKGAKSLLKQFAHSHVGYYGKTVFPHTLVGIGFKGNTPDLGPYMEAYDKE